MTDADPRFGDSEPTLTAPSKTEMILLRSLFRSVTDAPAPRVH